MTVITIDQAQLSTILAALRMYQAAGCGEPGNRSDDIHEIATDGGTQISLDADGIDALCEQINCSPDDDKPKCIATLTPEEDAAWVKSFNAALEQTGNDDEADRIAWAEIVQMFPRLAAFDGCKPGAADPTSVENAVTLPPDPDGINDERAIAAKRAVLAFALDFGEIPGDDDIDLKNLDYEDIVFIVERYGDPVGKISPELIKQNLCELLCNIGHFCDREGLHLSELLRMASSHYDAETDNEGTQTYSTNE